MFFLKPHTHKKSSEGAQSFSRGRDSKFLKNVGAQPSMHLTNTAFVPLLAVRLLKAVAVTQDSRLSLKSFAEVIRSRLASSIQAIKLISSCKITSYVNMVHLYDSIRAWCTSVPSVKERV